MLPIYLLDKIILVKKSQLNGRHIYKRTTYASKLHIATYLEEFQDTPWIGKNWQNNTLCSMLIINRQNKQEHNKRRYA